MDEAGIPRIWRILCLSWGIGARRGGHMKYGEPEVKEGSRDTRLREKAGQRVPRWGWSAGT